MCLRAQIYYTDRLFVKQIKPCPIPHDALLIVSLRLLYVISSSTFWAYCFGTQFLLPVSPSAWHDIWVSGRQNIGGLLCYTWFCASSFCHPLSLPSPWLDGKFWWVSVYHVLLSSSALLLWIDCSHKSLTSCLHGCKPGTTYLSGCTHSNQWIPSSQESHCAAGKPGTVIRAARLPRICHSWQNMKMKKITCLCHKIAQLWFMIMRLRLFLTHWMARAAGCRLYMVH